VVSARFYPAMPWGFLFTEKVNPNIFGERVAKCDNDSV
jgi:hypothetical protein